ncbi:pathogenesis-related protein 1 [Brachypodium distachyon]|uniref:SCP domain-containing protein n=1 Tax=Brachypodium distachyon TaxID=15368 RepID=I1IT63_BRADI|nr:pathogenesis-related protein 1 [Brachypodium distachyon]KQJ91648.1 hypothetical protein BRADI_4g38910v3 [Brachypodium distachyon]|eukprot:XP_003576890.1 pathogenesis-related protein 1 [Brachypodium distachyon]
MTNTRTALSILLLLLALLVAPPCTPAAASTGDADGRKARAAATVADILAAHNAARRAVGVGPLTWSDGIAGYAKAYARSRRSDCAPRRSPLFYFGENIAVGKGRRQWSGAALVNQWVDEGRLRYDYGSNSCGAGSGPAGSAVGSGCGRYRQVVWRNTTQLGCGMIVCGSGDTLLVCEYFPPGNDGDGRPY